MKGGQHLRHSPGDWAPKFDGRRRASINFGDPEKSTRPSRRHRRDGAASIAALNAASRDSSRFIVGTSQERWSDGAQEGVSVLCFAHAHQPCEHLRLGVDDTSHPNAARDSAQGDCPRRTSWCLWRDETSLLIHR
jgi:hypothetical protein